jgi:hypothetical protein
MPTCRKPEARNVPSHIEKCLARAYRQRGERLVQRVPIGPLLAPACESAPTVITGESIATSSIGIPNCLARSIILAAIFSRASGSLGVQLLSLRRMVYL